MSYFRSGDPLDDFHRWDREQEEDLKKLPVCDICNHPIQDDHFYQINGDNVCPGCLENEFRKEVDLDE